MRLVQVTIPAGKREAVLGILDREGVDYVVTDETSNREYVAVAYFPLPTGAVEVVLDALREEAGLERDAYTVVIDAQTVVSRKFEALEAEYESENDEDVARVARQELQARAADLLPDVRTYVALTVVSVVVATAGVLLDSPAIVVGSMVIAPLVGPAMSTAVGTVIADRDLFGRGVRLQALGAAVAILTATAFAVLARQTYMVPPNVDPTTISEVQERVAPGVLSLVVALGAGVAGAVSLSAAISTALVGVAIAVALVPPVAVVGVGVAWGMPSLALGALVLVAVNFLSINATAMVTLWWGGYRPTGFFEFERARTATARRVAVLVVAIAALALFLGAVTTSSMQRATFEERAGDAVADALATDEYRDLEQLHFEVRYADGLPVTPPEPRRVVVTMGRPNGERYPELAATIDRRIAAATDRSVVVEIRYVELSTSE